MVNTLLTELRGVRSKISVRAVSLAVASGNVSAIESALLLPSLDAALKRKYNSQIRAVLNDAGVASVKLQPKVLAGSFGSFDLTNPRAVEWARQKSSTLVAEVSNGQKAFVRRVIAEGIDEGIPVGQTARRLRDRIGLTVREEESVQNFQNKMFAKKVPLSAAEIDKRTARYARLVLKRRAEKIARTETIDAAIQGRKELWRQAVDKGLLDEEKVTQRWIVTPDDLLDSFICAPMAGVEVGLDEQFILPDGRAVDGPTAHPHCRCDVILIVPKPDIRAVV